MNQFVRPVNIPSPISGQPVAPRLIENDLPDKVVVEAHWIDPQSGAFIRKGIVEIREKSQINESLNDFPSPEATSPEAIDILLQCCDGEKDMYDVMNDPETEAEKEAAKILKWYYNDVSIERQLHPKDRFEEIFEIVARRVFDDFAEVDDFGR
jgi:hypothetical protein